MNQFPIPEAWTERRVTITVVGAGGTGSQLCDQLASLERALRELGHPGFRVTVFDPDRVTRASVGRQRFTPADVGGNKALLLVNRIRQFYQVEWEARPEAHDPVVYQSCDLLITCVDQALYRANLGKANAGRAINTLWIDAGNAASHGQVVAGHLGEPSGGRRLPNVFDLYPELASMHAVDREAPSCSAEESLRRQSWPVNRAAALHITDLLWTLFTSGAITRHAVHFTVNPMTSTWVPIDPATWALYGYTRAYEAEPEAPTRKRRAAPRRAA